MSMIITLASRFVKAFVVYFSQFHKYSLFHNFVGGFLSLWRAKTPVLRYLAQLVKDKYFEKLSVINHLFDELSEDYDFYSYETQNGEKAVGSILGALFLYFERWSGTDSVWDEFADLGNDRRKEILAAAYKQLLLNQVTELVKASAEAYRQDNEQK